MRGRGLAMAMFIGLLGLWHLSHAADFSCTAGDVACLIQTITTANGNGEANTITLEAGTYTLTAVDNTIDGPNGLPSVTSLLTIQGRELTPPSSNVTLVLPPSASGMSRRRARSRSTG